LPVHLAISRRSPGPACAARDTSDIDLGVVSALVPPAVVLQVVAECGRSERRVRALPAVLMVYFVIGLALFSGEGYREVLRKITGAAGGCRIATSSALARARRRLGPEPLERIFAGLCAAAAARPPGQACAFGRRVVLAAMDGTIVNVPDTAANAAAFGEPPLVGGAYGGGQGGYPQVRLLTVIDCGTRAVLAAAFGARKTSEHALARAAAAQGTIGPGMIILADRGFFGYPLISYFFNLGADLIWRIRADQILPRIAEFADGSYLSVIPETQEGRRRAMARHRSRPMALVPHGIPVRVIEADITITPAAGPPRTEYYRLAATLYDTRTAPALAIARTYAMRWHIETGYRELKTYLRDRHPVLRSTAPDGVTQEIWALLTAHQIIQATRADAATRHHAPPLAAGQTSYTVTLRAITRQITRSTRTRQPLRTAAAEILADLLPDRCSRSYPRGRKSSNARKEAAKTTPPGPITCTITIRQPAADP
jgi:hypothetical protein